MRAREAPELRTLEILTLHRLRNPLQAAWAIGNALWLRLALVVRDFGRVASSARARMRYDA